MSNGSCGPSSLAAGTIGSARSLGTTPRRGWFGTTGDWPTSHEGCVPYRAAAAARARWDRPLRTGDARPAPGVRRQADRVRGRPPGLGRVAARPVARPRPADGQRALRAVASIAAPGRRHRLRPRTRAQPRHPASHAPAGGHRARHRVPTRPQGHDAPRCAVPLAWSRASAQGGRAGDRAIGLHPRRARTGGFRF